MCYARALRGKQMCHQRARSHFIVPSSRLRGHEYKLFISGLRNAVKGQERKNMLTIGDMADGDISDEEEEEENEGDDWLPDDEEEDDDLDEEDLLTKHQLIVNFINYYRSQD